MQRRVGQLDYSMIPSSSTSDCKYNKDSVHDAGNSYGKNHNIGYLFQAVTIQMMLSSDMVEA
jgi:hypothetical protein